MKSLLIDSTLNGVLCVHVRAQIAPLHRLVWTELTVEEQLLATLEVLVVCWSLAVFVAMVTLYTLIVCHTVSRLIKYLYVQHVL